MTTPLRQALALAWLEADGFIKRRLFLTLLLVLGTAAFAALAPIALKYAVDGFKRGEGPGPRPELSALGAVAQLETVVPAVLILVYVGSLWLSRSLGEVRWFFFGTADQRLHRRLSRRLLSHIIDLPLAFHLDRKTGALNQTLVQGLAGYRILIEQAVFTVLPVLLEILIIGVVLALVLEVEFLAILALSVAAYIGVFVLGAARIVGPIRQVSTTQVDAYANLTDSILNTETIKAFNAERHVADRYDEALAHSERWWSVFYWRKSENGVLVAAVFALSIGAAMTLAGTRVQQGALSIGDFVLINAYMLQIVAPLEALGAAFRDIAHGAAFVEKMVGLMAQKPERRELAVVAGDARRDDEPGRLEVRDLRFSYVPGRPVLDGVDFTIEPGQTVAVVGKSGAGKSSLIRLLMRFYEPDSGDIRLNGFSIRELTLDDLRLSIAIVPQDTVLFNDTIAYNIGGFDRFGVSAADIEEAARCADFHDRITEMPEGYETIVGERGLKLSGGEKQRVSIARAVLKRPRTKSPIPEDGAIRRPFNRTSVLPDPNPRKLTLDPREPLDPEFSLEFKSLGKPTAMFEFDPPLKFNGSI